MDIACFNRQCPVAPWNLRRESHIGLIVAVEIGEETMRSRVGLLIMIVAALGLGGCTRTENDSAARDAGRTAHDIVNKTEKAAKKAERDLEKAAKDAREGWKEADREDKTKPHK